MVAADEQRRDGRCTLARVVLVEVVEAAVLGRTGQALEVGAVAGGLKLS